MSDEELPWRAADARVVRCSVPLASPDQAERYARASHYPAMFSDDVAASLFPIGGEIAGRPVFSLRWSSPGSATMLADAFRPVGGHVADRGSVSAHLAGFGLLTARGLLEVGQSDYEVAVVQNGKEQGVGFSVVQVEGVLPSRVLQRVDLDRDTSGSGVGFRIGKSRLVRLPRHSIVRVRLPRAYRGLRRGLLALKDAGTAVPDFAVDNWNPDGTTRVGFDLQELIGLEHRAVASITRSTGWNARGSFGEASTAYYTMHRFLRFQEFEVHLRSTVVDAVDEILAIAGSELGFQCKVALQNLPTLDGVQRDQERLSEGDLRPEELMTKYSFYKT